MSKQKTLGEVITETNIQTYQRMYESLRVATHAGFSNSIIKQMRDEMKAVRMGIGSDNMPSDHELLGTELDEEKPEYACPICGHQYFNDESASLKRFRKALIPVSKAT